MPDLGGQSVRRRRLAAELRRLRERAGLTGDQVAEGLGWSGSKISRIELNRIGVKLADLRKLLDLYGVSPAHRADLEALASEPVGTGLLDVQSSGLTAELSTLIDEETEAKSVWTWEPQLVPGLLQTESYARAVIAGWTAIMPTPREEVERRVEARLARQRLLVRDPPLELLTVIDESVLHRKIGSGSVMREQLEHLVTVGRMPSIRLQILALGGDHPIGTGSFNYMQFTQRHTVPLNEIVNVEQLARNYQIYQESETLQYQVAFRRLAELALAPDDSRAVILQAIRETWPDS
ncbi:MAG: helix-turn-helix transcriptional regulator [Streptosporangiaceae bacterium]|jgi:transcriptional regulator with XRE-family HTH domain